MPTALFGRVAPAARTGSTTIQWILSHPGVRDARLRAVSRYIGWQAWERVVRRPVTMRLPGGASMRCYPHSSAASLMLYCRLPEWDTMRFVLDYLRPGDVFVDVGANVGSYTLLAGEVPGVRVVAFEPASSTYPRLVENVRLNRWMDVTLHRCAVGDADADALLTRDLDATNRIVAAGSEPNGTEPNGTEPNGTEPVQTEHVRMVRLDTALAGQSGIAVIKIDVEGHEPEVLAGARDVVRRCRPVLVVEHNDATRLAAFFDEVGYLACRYLPDSRELVPTGGSVGGAGGAGASETRIMNVVAVPADELDTGVHERLTER